MSEPIRDPMDGLRAPIVPVDPDPTFAARLRQQLENALLDTRGGTMTDTESHASGTVVTEDLAWPPTLTPYIAVRDGREAIEWYVDVFGAERRGEPYVMPDGSIGHAELGLGDAVLMLSEGSSEVPVAAPTGATFSHTLHLQVDDVDATIRAAARRGADVEREPVDEPYGRVGVIVDPFGHRWMLNQPPGRATRARHGDVGYITIAVPDDKGAKAFYGAVLGWEFTAGRVPRGWNVDRVQPEMGLWGGAEQREIQLAYRVSDIDAAVERVRQHGGEAQTPERMPYGLLAECIDDQGAHFQLWQPVD